MKKLATLSLACLVLWAVTVRAQGPDRPQTLGGSGKGQAPQVNQDKDRKGPKPRVLDPIEHKKRIYVDNEKRLYVALSAPIFLRLALSPNDGDPSYLFHAPGSQVALPFHLDGPGVHSIRHPASHNDPGFKVNVYADAAAPTTKTRFSDAPYYQDGERAFFGKGLSVTLDAQDDMTSVQQTYLSLDDALFTVYKEQLSFAQEKPYRLRYYSVDNVGNSERVAELTFSVDVNSPTVTARFSGASIGSVAQELSYPSGTTLEMTATDAGSGVDRLVLAVNSEPEQAYSAPVRFDRPGDYTVVVRATDKVGNSENQILRFKIN